MHSRFSVPSVSKKHFASSAYQSYEARPSDSQAMRALAKLKPGPGLEMTELPKPTVGHNDVLIRIRKTAICGTDIHIWKWDDWAQKTIPVPMQVGHEYV